MTGTAPYGAIRDGAVGVRGGRIAWVGERDALPAGATAKRRARRRRRLADARARRLPHAPRLRRRSRRRVRRAARGARATPTSRAPAAASTRRCARPARRRTTTLVAASRPRLAALAAEGVTTVEIKSGYGLDTANELKQLAAARRGSAAAVGVDVRTTLLAAHAVPPEFAGRADAYIDRVCAEMIPAVARARARRRGRRLLRDDRLHARADAPRVRRRRAAHGLPVKLHADQLSDPGGAALAAGCAALSADHLEYTSDEGVAAMARAGTVAVLLPGAFYALRETRLPPIAALRRHGVPMAVATDCNPGTSPATSLLLMLNMACTLFRLTPEEALAGATEHAARALGLADRGVVAAGPSRRPRAVRDCLARRARLSDRRQPLRRRRARRRRPALERRMNLYTSPAATRRWSSTFRTPERSCPRNSRRDSLAAGARGTRHRLARRQALLRPSPRATGSRWSRRRIRATSSTSTATRRAPRCTRAPTTPSSARRGRSTTRRSTRARRPTTPKSPRAVRGTSIPTMRRWRRRSRGSARATAGRSCSTATRSAPRCRGSSPGACPTSTSGPPAAAPARRRCARPRRRCSRRPRASPTSSTAASRAGGSHATTAAPMPACTRCSSRSRRPATWTRRRRIAGSPRARQPLVAVLERLVQVLAGWRPR